MKNLLLLPLPPPFAGPEMIAFNLVRSAKLKKSENIILQNANIHNSNADKGSFTISGFKNFILIIINYLKNLRHVKGVFVYLSSSRLGFFKDSIYIYLAILSRRKVVAQYHGSNFYHFYEFQSWLYRRYIEFTLRRLSKILVLGKTLKPIFYDIDPTLKIDVLPNGLDVQQYTVLKKNIPGSEFTILFMGHLIFSKGFYDLIISYKQLYSKYRRRISINFAGENIGYSVTTLEFLSGKFYEQFKKYGKEIDAEIQDFIKNSYEYNAHYLGFVSGKKKIQALATADLFVLPSYTEGFSMAVLEAMAVGLPVIVTPVGAMPEVVQDDINGKITPVGNPDKLALNIEYFIMNPEKARQIGTYNREYVKRNYDIEIVAEKLLTILNDV